MAEDRGRSDFAFRPADFDTLGTSLRHPPVKERVLALPKKSAMTSSTSTKPDQPDKTRSQKTASASEESASAVAPDQQDDAAGHDDAQTVKSIVNVSLPDTKPGSLWQVKFQGGKVAVVEPYVSDGSAQDSEDLNGHGGLLAPSLCHPHVHLDKAFLIGHPDYEDYEIYDGNFEEALNMTNDAKARFTERDLRERGSRLLEESIEAGATHFRAFVEVDSIVYKKCLEAGLWLKDQYESTSNGPGAQYKIQICAYAQLPLFTTAAGDTDGHVIRHLMKQAAAMPNVEAIGSTPYVEKGEAFTHANIDFMIDLSIEHQKHLDFHLDYNIDKKSTPSVWYVIQALKKKGWLSKTGGQKTVVFGHCTRLTLWEEAEWVKLAEEIGDLPISFCGLPSSDLYMLKNEQSTAMAGQSRHTLDVVKLIAGHNLNACLGNNNIGNAFTPQGNCDPLLLACNGVGLYQAGPIREAELLYECVSTRARKAIGYGRKSAKAKKDEHVLKIQPGHLQTHTLLFPGREDGHWRTRRTISEAVYYYDGAAKRHLMSNAWSD